MRSGFWTDLLHYSHAGRPTIDDPACNIYPTPLPPVVARRQCGAAAAAHIVPVTTPSARLGPSTIAHHWARPRPPILLSHDRWTLAETLAHEVFRTAHGCRTRRPGHTDHAGRGAPLRAQHPLRSAQSAQSATLGKLPAYSLPTPLPPATPFYHAALATGNPTPLSWRNAPRQPSPDPP